MSDLKDRLKDRIRRPSVHEQLIDPVETDENEDVNTNRNVNVNVNDDTNTNINVYSPPRVNRRPKFEDTHTRQTYYIENELLEELTQLAGNEKGEKTRIINEALRGYLKKKR